jgi:hypothetical protein
MYYYSTDLLILEIGEVCEQRNFKHENKKLFT